MFSNTLLAGISLSGSLCPAVDEGSPSGSAVPLSGIQCSREPTVGGSFPSVSPGSLNHRELPRSHCPELLSARRPGNQAQMAGSSPNRAQL